ncbi:glutamate ligase domain-containing protein [Lacticaseibacillus absianus]|uniref:glutamate ligase domain-containing protein n=1 Tax=Lacticaseibacillus absianus TaxID=2729623 RepID=UPI0015CA6BA7
MLEAGLGGATDATNAIHAAQLIVFTHLALDHTAQLGPTVAAIAANKAQIIKSAAPVVIAPHQPAAAWAVLTTAARRHHAPVVAAQAVSVTVTTATLTGTQLTLAGQPVHLAMLGAHQVDNARTAWAASTVLIAQGVLPDAEPMRQALAHVQLPGRLQALDTQTFLDAGHNPDALGQVLATLRAQRPVGGRLLVVAGFLADKDVQALAHLLTLADAVWVTTPAHPQRALSGARLQRLVPGSQFSPSVRAGLAAARDAAGPQDLILVTGSFYLIGDLIDD